MSCLLSSGVTRSCGFQFGGLKKVYIANFEEVSGVTYSGNTGLITAITMIPTGTSWYSFEYEPNTAQKLEELQAGAVSRFVNQTLNMKLANVTQAKKLVIESLANATVSVILQTQDDLYWMYGEPTKSAGLRATVLSIDSGTAQADDAAVTITLVGGNLGYANQVTSSAVAAVV
jgi:hypothetical protein